MTKPTEQDLDRLVQQNVLCCLSSMVSTLAQGYGLVSGGGDLSLTRLPGASSAAAFSDLVEQASNLAAPVDDYEEAARQAGWTHTTDPHYFSRKEADGSCHLTIKAESWQALCEAHDLEPYQWEVFEHWAVDSWFAEKLEAQGEKVDRDFANLNVWARTTSGQAISMDGVIARIWTELHKDDKAEG